MAAVAAAVGGGMGFREEPKHGALSSARSGSVGGPPNGGGGGATCGPSKKGGGEAPTQSGRRSHWVPLATQGELSDSAKLAIMQSLDPKVQCLVECGSAVGVFSVETQRMLCLCKQCMGPQTAGSHGPEFMPSEFERHGGMAACKKWRFSVKVREPVIMWEGGLA
jgi:hypothetical protein